MSFSFLHKEQLSGHVIEFALFSWCAANSGAEEVASCRRPSRVRHGIAERQQLRIVSHSVRTRTFSASLRRAALARQSALCAARDNKNMRVMGIAANTTYIRCSSAHLVFYFLAKRTALGARLRVRLVFLVRGILRSRRGRVLQAPITREARQS